MTPAQHYALKWIDEHGAFTYPKHPDGWRRLGVPREHRNGFNSATMNILTEQGWVKRVGRDAAAQYTITGEGRKALAQFASPNPEQSSAEWYLMRLTDLLERLSKEAKAELCAELKSLYEEYSGGRLP